MPVKDPEVVMWVTIERAQRAARRWLKMAKSDGMGPLSTTPPTTPDKGRAADRRRGTTDVR